MEHTFGEIKSAVIDLLTGQVGAQPPHQFNDLITQVPHALAKRGLWPGAPQSLAYPPPTLSSPDREILRDVFWDLIRLGYITPGLDNSNSTLPWFRLSHFGKLTIGSQAALLFYDVQTYLDLVVAHVNPLSEVTRMYLIDSIRAFYSECLLASCVMLGVATENEFLLLRDKAQRSAKYGERFQAIKPTDGILRQMISFQKALTPILPVLPYEIRENIETELTAVQHVIRRSRNDAGHPTGVMIDRLSLNAMLLLFPPHAKKLHQLGDYLIGN